MTDTSLKRRFGLEPNEAAMMVQRAQGYRPNEAFCLLPTPSGLYPYRLPLSSVIADPSDELVFHAGGDTGGVADPNPQLAVAAAMTADAGSSGATFFYHLGDVGYYNGRDSVYYPQFYEPYLHYPGPIFAIPGNHDGDNSDDTTVPSLTGFVTNFCQKQPMLTADAQDVNRDALDQPNVFWTLTANLATIIGLYTNVPSGGQVDNDQAAWFQVELAAAPKEVPLIVALHHPPYSADAMHGGSARMGSLIDTACAAAGRWPNLVLSGHVHDYQAFTRIDTATRPKIKYLVAGASGYHNLHAMAPGIGALPWAVPGSDVTLDAYCDTAWGFLTLTITAKGIHGVYTTVDRTGKAKTFDTFDTP